MKPCWTRYILWLTISVAAASAMLSSCGQTGPLYLPENTQGADGKNKDEEKK